MEIKTILVIGRNPGMLESVTTLLRQHGYTVTGFQTNEEAIAAFRANPFEAVVIGGGVDAESRQLFHTLFPSLHPPVRMINAHPHTVLDDLRRAFGG